MRRSFFTPRWMITTLLVIIAAAVMVCLGIWQLDRLDQRRVFNASVSAQISAPELDLNQDLPTSGLDTMEYREVVARGEYDPQNQVVLRNQIYDNLPGYHLLTPLHIEGSTQSVLVDRGFIPMVDGKPADLAQYQQDGTVTVQGIIRLPHVPRFAGVPDPTLTPGETRLDAWNAINLERIAGQVPYDLLPVYVEAEVGQDPAVYPVGGVDTPDLSEGPHLGYAFQWFTFAALLSGGYPFFVRKQLKGANK